MMDPVFLDMIESAAQSQVVHANAILRAVALMRAMGERTETGPPLPPEGERKHLSGDELLERLKRTRGTEMNAGAKMWARGEDVFGEASDAVILHRSEVDGFNHARDKEQADDEG